MYPTTYMYMYNVHVHVSATVVRYGRVVRLNKAPNLFCVRTQAFTSASSRICGGCYAFFSGRLHQRTHNTAACRISQGC